MDENLIPIGKMADINHVSIATLRLYDEMGLLKPRFIDAVSKYRYYSIEQNARLDLIAYMKDLGMSLKEIRDVLRNENIDEIEAILSLKKEQIYRQISLLKMRLHCVDDSIQSIERFRKAPLTGVCSLEYIPQRYVYGIDCKNDFYRKGIVGYEKDLTCLRNHLFSIGLDQIYSYPVGTSISMDDFVNGRLLAKKIFIFLDHKIEKLVLDKVESNMFATVYSSSFDDEIVEIERLREYCRVNSYKVCGDYLCEVLTEFNVFDENRRNMFLKLQVPVSFLKESA